MAGWRSKSNSGRYAVTTSTDFFLYRAICDAAVDANVTKAELVRRLLSRALRVEVQRRERGK